MRHRRGLAVFLTAGLLAAATGVACHEEPATGPTIDDVRFARPGTQDPEVTGTNPAGAPQDTTLDVVVAGSGFDRGSSVALTLGGTPTEKVRTNSTRYVNPRKLVANVTIAPDAPLDFYDVEVTTSSRKKGIGTEMFEVFVGGGVAIMVEFRRPASGELGGFFRPTTTMDFATREPQPVQGKLNENSIDTKLTPFTLWLEPAAEFYDGKDPDADPSCETGYLKIILDAAESNGGRLDGLLDVSAQWDHPVTTVVAVHFIVAVGQWEYKISIPMGGSPEEDRTVLNGADHTIVAIRDGHYGIYRRKLGRKGTWWSMEPCLVAPDVYPSNGLMDFEIWVWR